KDAVLYDLPAPSEGHRGRPRTYGAQLPSPEELRQDPSTAWTSVRVFAAGRDLPLRVIVIRPLAYRLSKSSALLYRQPAYLITTDLDSHIEELLQAYF